MVRASIPPKKLPRAMLLEKSFTVARASKRLL
jgi:hypothetical protein